MAASAEQVRRLRRMIAESTSTIYTDSDLSAYITRYPLLDERGEEPYTWDTSTDPPTQDANEDWIATYDLNAAAADIWEEKAAAAADEFAYSADGGSFQRNQKYEQYMKQATRYRSRRSMGTVTMTKWPEESGVSGMWPTWIANNPEPD